MIAQYTAAGLVAALRSAATPLAVQSASTSAGQEDHVSMSFEAAQRTRRSVPNLRAVLAVELLCAAQALELRAPLKPAPGTGALLSGVREQCAPLEADRILAEDLAAVEDWLRGEHWNDVLTGVVEPLR